MKSSKDTNKKRKLIDIELRRRYGISYSFKKIIEDEQNKLKDTDANKYASRTEHKTKKSTKKIQISNLLMEAEKQELIKLYGDDDKVKHQILPLLNFTKISDCSIMKYGSRKSAIEIEYSYCKTCDYNSLKPICLTCINKCHYGHVIKFIFKKRHIKCSCGEKNHMIMKINYKKISNMNCLCNEWNSTANLKYYYTDKNKEPICILCEYCCTYDRMKNIVNKLKKNKVIPNCSCKNKIIHNDKRTICEKLLNLISSANDYNILLHPVQFVNMIFKSKNNFKYIFEYFDFFISDLNNSRENSHIIELLSKMRRIDVEYTNIYKTLIIFEKIVEKTGRNNIYFYHKEVTDYFSFNLVKKLLEILMESSIEEKLFYQLSNKFLYLFHKIYINEKTKLLYKFKLTDLKHLNYLTRNEIYNQNKKNFIESQAIISFLIDFISYINNKRPSLIEAIHCVKEIAAIFRKLSCYNLIKNHDMVKICTNISDSFNWIWNIKLFILKNDQKDIKSKIDSYYFNNISIKGFYVIIKMLQNFIYNYNDNIIDIIINNKKQYPNIHDIKMDNICFIFKKNELGELINKLAIYVLSILETTYKKVVNKRILLIKRLSMQIIEYGLNEDDIYMLNIVDSIYKFRLNNNLENNIYYNEFERQTNIILNSFNQYFNFEMTMEETLNIINNSLNSFLDENDIKKIETFNVEGIIHKFNPEQKMAIFYTNFFYLIYKIIGIINNHQKRKKECEKKEKFKNLNDLVVDIPSSLEEEIYKKIIIFSFCFVTDSADCSFLIVSHYIFKELIKIPEKYCHLLFKLFHLCFKNIFESENNTIKMDSSFLIKRLYNYLDELMNNKDLKNDNNNILIKCIDEFLQILEIATLNCEYSIFNIFIYKIQYLIIMVQKKYNLVQKYFDLENQENSSNINSDEINIITKIFSSYMKLINNCFDMSIEEDRRKIKEIINMDNIINVLKNNNGNLNIDLKTEFLRFIRKNMIDLKYSSSENYQYSKAIINNKDNLEELKDNSLLSYSNYPTKLLSFMKDFYSITAICSLKEKIEDKKNEKVKTQVVKKNSNIRNWVIEKKGNRDLNLSHEISDLGETKLEISGFFEEYKNNTPHHNSNIDNDTVYQNVKFSNYLENERRINHISRPTNISKLLSHTEVYRNKSNKLITIVPREKKKIMNFYLYYEEKMVEKEIDKKDVKILKDIIKENNNEKLLNKSKELNILEDAFNRKFFYIINKEIDELFQKDWKLDNDEIINSFRNYIENGILIPVIFYFKKILIMVDSFTGYEMIQLFSLLEKCLKLKLYLYENKNIWMKERKSKKFILFQKCNIFNISSNNKNISMIDYTKLQSEENYQLTKESLNLIKSNKISVYDYSILYQLLEKELFSLIKERKVFIFNYKNNRDKYDYEDLLKKEKKDFILSEEQKRLIKALIIYKNSKIIYNNENNSSILSILSEINLEYEINFRNLLISSLIYHSKDLNVKNEFLTISYYLLFKLLLLQTEETQSEIINIINKPENKNQDFIKDLSKILYNKIILSIIEYLNPSDKLIYSNYLISCYLLWIFKFLCAKENKIFKLKFIRELSYKYISNIFNFFRDNQATHNNLILEKSLFESSAFGDNYFFEEKNKTSLDKNGKEINKDNTHIKIIKFYDFLLLLIPKICLISNWDKIQKLPQDNFLFDLFSSIIDLLSEIINGKKSELLSILFDDIIITKGGGNYEKIKKIESFQNFVKEIANIIIDKKNNNELNIQVKQKLIDYINSIIEEKDCDETLQKCIEKFLNINKIYRNISIIMKIYFLKNIKHKNEEKPQKKEPANPGKKKNSATYFPFEKNLTYEKKSNFLLERKNKKNYEEISTSKNKMLNLMVDANRDLKKNLFAIKMQKNNQNKEINGENKTFRSINNKFDPEMKLSLLTFGKHLYEYFINEFNYNIQFMECSDFKLCISYYKYIKFIKLKKEDNDQYEMDNIVKMYYKEDININEEDNFEDLYCSNNIDNEHISQMEKDYIEKYFIEKFFEGIISTIEIINQNKNNKIILFTKFPLMKYITYQTKSEFRENVNRDSEFSKKYDLIKYIDYFIEEINYNKRNKTKFNFLTKINFHYLPQLSYYLAVFHNLFFLFTMKGDNQISISDSLMYRIKDINKINILINKSANEWDNIYLIFCIFYIIINASFIFIWMMINLPLYYKINKADYLKMRTKKNRKMGIFDKIYITIIILLLKGDYILPLIYEFVLCLICIFSNQRKIIFPFLLIPILYINKTLRNIIVSIRLNFNPFTLTFFCAFILMFVLSNIYFFFFNSDFEKDINYYPDNCCKTLAFAFLNALDNGLRARGGMGDSAKRISFKRDRDHYILRLIVDDIFFFFIVIIMIDLVFGIVLRSFDKLQHRNYKYDLDKRKHCFICNSKKESLEKDRINFFEHVNIKHNVWNYIEYMIKIKLKEEIDLNQVNDYVLDKINKKDISWLPTHKELEIDNLKDKYNPEDKNIIILNENFPNYKIKQGNYE